MNWNLHRFTTDIQLFSFKYVNIFLWLWESEGLSCTPQLYKSPDMGPQYPVFDPGKQLHSQ